jgi:hypothetical protein
MISDRRFGSHDSPILALRISNIVVRVEPQARAPTRQMISQQAFVPW